MSEFPRPCIRCGNLCHLHKGKLVHVRLNREHCHIFRAWDFVRDERGIPKKMEWLGDFVITDGSSPQEEK